MKVAAYQAPLLPGGWMDAISLIRRQVQRCEAESVSLLCCPEAILGGLADYHPDPLQIALTLDNLRSILAPLASDTVTSIVGFTEIAASGQLFNAAAVLHRGEVLGVYRKMYPAIRRSVYAAGGHAGVFEAHGLTFGITICNDSNYRELASEMARQGAAAIFVPTNNGLLPGKAGPKIAAAARRVDVATALENRVWIIRADIVSSSCSEIVDPLGRVVREAGSMIEELLISEI